MKTDGTKADIKEVIKHVTKADLHFAFKDASEQFPDDIMIVRVNDYRILLIPQAFLYKFHRDRLWDKVAGERLSPDWGMPGWGSISLDGVYHSYKDCMSAHRGMLISGISRESLLAEIKKAISLVETVKVTIDLLND